MKAGIRMLTFVLLSLAFVTGGCNTPPKKGKEKAQQEKKTPKIKPEQEASDVDFDSFLGRLRKAVAARDMNTIATMMTADFGYSLNPERSGDGVFQFWDENNLWPELEGILSERFVKKFNPDKVTYYMVAPPQFADPSLNYDGYRAGFRRDKGSWKFAYFVNG